MNSIFRFFNLHGLYKSEKAIFYFTLFYILLFTALAFSKGNREFIFYSITMLIVLELGIYLNKQIRLPEMTIIGLSILGLLHIIGGNINIGGDRIYDISFFYGLIRYDNIVHIFGTMMGAFVLNTMFFSYSVERTNIRLGLYYFALVLMAMGVGVINEIVEFMAVLFFHAEQQVGGYINNTIDMIFNVIGALIAVIIIDSYRLYKLIK